MKKVLLLIFILFTIGAIYGQNESKEEGTILEDKIQNSIWYNPEFDVAQNAFYYVHVLEIPAPRWSTYEVKALGIEPPKDFPATIQERAWSSPIWYSAN